MAKEHKQNQIEVLENKNASEAKIEAGLSEHAELVDEVNTSIDINLNQAQLEAISDEENNVIIENPEKPEIEIAIEKKYELPKGFVYLDDIVPYAQYDIRYFSDNNFVGNQIEGYKAPLAIGTLEMAEALVKVSEELYAQGFNLLIYDTYRPAKAVSYFKEWSKTDDTTMKEQYYPNESKSELFNKGYLSSRSGHSRGSTVDLTLVYNDTGELVDMGSEYDLLDEKSSFKTKNVTNEQAKMRELLRDTMVKYGFKEYSKEWWHYVLKNEPYPNTYFDFDVQ